MTRHERRMRAGWYAVTFIWGMAAGAWMMTILEIVAGRP